MSSTDQKIILITGASRGLGYALATALAGPETHLIALARTTGGLEELADAVEAKGGAITMVPLDVTDEAGLQRMGLSIHQRWGRVDAWYHTAIHAPLMSPVGHVTDKDFDKTFAINARAVQRLITMVDPLLRAAPGAEAHFMDHAVSGKAFMGAYGASKAAARALIESYIAETAPLENAPRVKLHSLPDMLGAVQARFHPGRDDASFAKPADVAVKILAGAL